MQTFPKRILLLSALASASLTLGAWTACAPKYKVRYFDETGALIGTLNVKAGAQINATPEFNGKMPSGSLFADAEMQTPYVDKDGDGVREDTNVYTFWIETGVQNGNAGEYTHRVYSAVTPSNWNLLTYQDNNDTQIIDYLNSPFFEYDFAYDETGAIDENGYSVHYSFATAVQDVSETYGGVAGGGTAWKITLRADGKWDDGTPIVAEDFVYTMKEQLDPAFRHYRADSFYEGALAIKNAKNYAYQGRENYPAIDFSAVGISAPDDTTLLLQLEKPLKLLNDDGGLSYVATYNLGSLPLVHKTKYENSKKRPVAGSTLWTTDYNSSVANTASWGPYKLTSFQAGKQYVLEKNPYWYGWKDDAYQGQYQTTKIVGYTVAAYNTAWMMFQKGQLDEIGIDVSLSADYKESRRAYFTPDDYVGSLQLQSSEKSLKERESAGVNKTILSYVDFRKALSLGLNRAQFAKSCTTSSMQGFGLFNTMHYYDVANGGAYRDTEQAKRVLCQVYDVEPADYPSLDDAVNAITGYDLEKARALVKSAYEKAKADGKIKDGDKVVLTYGTAVDNETTRRYFDFLQRSYQTLMVGTPLEGKFELEFNASYGDDWGKSFRAGAYEICQGGWRGAAWDPGYFLLAYISPDYMFSASWDTANTEMLFTVKGVQAVLDGGELTFNAETGLPVTQVTNDPNDRFTYRTNLLDWYALLNGDWKTGFLNEEYRLDLIAALEAQVLLHYYTVPLTNHFSASLMSYKTDYITYDYNTFMGYGGVRYLHYNYDDAEWAAYVKSQKDGVLNYK